MANDFIPAGRTSQVKKGRSILQIQTEYASRPKPQVTTTISNEGRVVHKIRRDLDKPVASLEESNKMEYTIKRQHAEVIDIIQSEFYKPDAFIKSINRHTRNIPTREKLASIPGVKKIFRLDNEGNFIGNTAAQKFQNDYSFIFKNLQEIIKIFERVPGIGFTRKKGVYEVERDKLYFVSAGSECYFIMVEPVKADTDFEREIKDIIVENPFPLRKK